MWVVVVSSHKCGWTRKKTETPQEAVIAHVRTNSLNNKSVLVDHMCCGW